MEDKLSISQIQHVAKWLNDHGVDPHLTSKFRNDFIGTPNLSELTSQSKEVQKEAYFNHLDIKVGEMEINNSWKPGEIHHPLFGEKQKPIHSKFTEAIKVAHDILINDKILNFLGK